MEKPITFDQKEQEWLRHGLDFICEVAIAHANDELASQQEWESVYDSASDIKSLIDSKSSPDQSK